MKKLILCTLLCLCLALCTACTKKGSDSGNFGEDVGTLPAIEDEEKGAADIKDDNSDDKEGDDWSVTAVSYEDYSIRLATAELAPEGDFNYSFASDWGDMTSTYNLSIVDDKGNEEVVATLNFGYYGESWVPTDEDCTVIGHKGSTWLFNIFYDVGSSATFLYNIAMDTLTPFEEGAWVSEDHVNDDYILATSLAFGAGDLISMYIYDWDGDLLYARDDVLGAEIAQGRIYTVSYEGDRYVIYGMNYPDFSQESLCTMKISADGYLWLQSDGVHFTYPDENYNWGEEVMSFDNLHDVGI